MRKGERPLQVGVEGCPLFDDRPPAVPIVVELKLKPTARSTDPETSKAAAASMVDEAGRQRDALAAWLVTQGPNGATADEADPALNWRPTTAGRRFGELVRDGRAIRLDGLDGRPKRKRTTGQGRDAFVLVAPCHLDAARLTE